MKIRAHSSLLLAMIVFIGACGAKISEKEIRQSDRFYQAAFISWFEEHDNLKAIRHLTRAVEANPDNDSAHYLLGNIRLARGELDLAETHLRKAEQLRGEDRPTAKADAQNSLGVLLIHQKKFDEAIKFLKACSSQVLNREPWLALGNLGWAYTEIGEYDKAIDVLKRAMFEQPQFCVGRFRLGQAYYKKGDYDTAKPNLEEVVNDKESGCSRMQQAYHLLGMVYLRLEMDKEAVESFGTCMEIDPTSELGVACAKNSRL